MLGTLALERLKVTALNLFDPTASSPFPKSWFSHIMTQSLEGEGKRYVSLPGEVRKGMGICRGSIIIFAQFWHHW